jgi:predicted nuclease of predicted toxin-antitoxin system
VRVLLDESVPRRLARLILGHEVTTVVDHGWAGLRNGELLKRASSEFDVFVTVDRNLPQQQDLQRYPIAVVILEAPTNRLDDLRQLVPQLLRALDELPGSLTVIRGLK